MMSYMIETLWFSKETYLPGSDLPTHSHKYFHYIYVLSGTAEISVGESSYIASANELYLTPPGVTHSIEILDDKGISVIELKFMISDMDMYSKTFKHTYMHKFVSGEIRSILLKIIEEGLKKETHYKEMVDIKILELLLHISRIESSGVQTEENVQPVFERYTDMQSDSDEQIKKAIAYIHCNMSKPLSLENIAAQSNMSKFHFCRNFKRIKGTSPIQYIIRHRIEKAKELMLHSDLNITQIAQDIGFEDIHYFSRYFRQKEGISPQMFIKKYRKNMYFVVTDDSSKLSTSSKDNLPDA